MSKYSRRISSLPPSHPTQFSVPSCPIRGLLCHKAQQIKAARSVLASFGAKAKQIAKAYAHAPRAKVQEILETLAAQRFVRVGEGGEYGVA